MGTRKRRVETGSCTAGEGDLKDKMIINQIMLRYRPIAPRPVTAERSVSVPLMEKRVKRKYVRVKKKSCSNLKTGSDTGWMGLLDNRPRPEFVVKDLLLQQTHRLPDEWIGFDVSRKKMVGNETTQDLATVGLHETDLPMPVKLGHVVESWVTMESVTGTCETKNNEQIWKDLEMDGYPGFISNSNYDEVKWVNTAYRRMVDPNPNPNGDQLANNSLPEVVVWLRHGVKMEELFMVEYWPAFSCRVRIMCKFLEKKKQMTVPCDVWKMDSGGGYAWRLDVKAALSLGRLN